MVSRANDLLFKNRNEKLPAGELWASIAEAGQNGKLFQWFGHRGSLTWFATMRVK